jgi:hypothetical protein
VPSSLNERHNRILVDFLAKLAYVSDKFVAYKTSPL